MLQFECCNERPKPPDNSQEDHHEQLNQDTHNCHAASPINQKLNKDTHN